MHPPLGGGGVLSALLTLYNDDLSIPQSDSGRSSVYSYDSRSLASSESDTPHADSSRYGFGRRFESESENDPEERADYFGVAAVTNANTIANMTTSLSHDNKKTHAPATDAGVAAPAIMPARLGGVSTQVTKSGGRGRSMSEPETPVSELPPALVTSAPCNPSPASTETLTEDKAPVTHTKCCLEQSLESLGSTLVSPAMETPRPRRARGYSNATLCSMTSVASQSTYDSSKELEYDRKGKKRWSGKLKGGLSSVTSLSGWMTPTSLNSGEYFEEKRKRSEERNRRRKKKKTEIYVRSVTILQCQRY